jgi:DNA polymerase III alpha subunit (gram-positive type)
MKLFYDSEVTSFNPLTGGIIQIGAIIEDKNGDITDELNFFQNPNTYPQGVEINDSNLERCHQTRAKLETYPDQKEVFEKFIDQIDRYGQRLTLVGHNIIKHDLRFLEEWFRENGKNVFDYINYNPIDTLTLAVILKDTGRLDVKTLSLGSLCEHFNIPLKQWHNAKDDANAVRELYTELVSLF